MRTDRSDRPWASAGRARTRRPAAAIGAGALVLALSVGTSGCSDLHLEGATPTTPSAGAVEQVRQRAAEQAAALAASVSALEGTLQTAGGTAVGAPSADAAALATALAGAREAARTHLDDLGGVWVPFPDASPSSATPQHPSPDEGATPGASPSAAGDVAALVRTLGAAAEATQADAAAVTDRRLARLLASIGLADELWAARLAALAGLPAPAGPAPVAPAGVPAGLSADALAPLIASEDALGAAWELAAARSADAARDHAAGVAAAHRDAAQAWAQAAGLSGVAGDPRRAAYQLPAVLTDPASAPEARTAVLAGLEDRLAGTWLDLVAQADPGGRDALVSAARTAVARAIELSGAAIPALPAIDPAVTSAG